MSMLFDYEVLTEDQANKERYQLLNDGMYPAVIKRVEHKVSSTGNNMYELDLDVYDENGRNHFIRDYVVFTRSMSWKVIHFADSTGTLAEYESKKFTPDLLLNKSCVVMLKTQQGGEIPSEKLNGKPVGSRYPDKNVIQDYVKKCDQVAQKKVANSDLPFNDDLPF